MSDPPTLSPADGHEHHHLLVQAPVPAVDVDGIRVVTVGTVLYGLAAVVLALFYPRLVAADRGWWLGVCVSGFALGLVGLVYCWNRVRQRRQGTGPTAAGAAVTQTSAP